MLPFHERLATVGLAAVGEYGFVLAGGYAILANGIGDRPSQDVDLFTNIPDPTQFSTAADALRNAFGADGLDVTDILDRPTFLNVRVADQVTGESSELQLGLDFRSFPPAQLSVGPVLDVRDAVAGKFSALWSRGEARDYIDIDAVVESGRFSRTQMLEIADTVEAQPMDRSVLAARFREANRHNDDLYRLYEVTPERREKIIARFADWADQIDPATVSGALVERDRILDMTTSREKLAAIAGRYARPSPQRPTRTPRQPQVPQREDPARG